MPRFAAHLTVAARGAPFAALRVVQAGLQHFDELSCWSNARRSIFVVGCVRPDRGGNAIGKTRQFTGYGP